MHNSTISISWRLGDEQRWQPNSLTPQKIVLVDLAATPGYRPLRIISGVAIATSVERWNGLTVRVNGLAQLKNRPGRPVQADQLLSKRACFEMGKGYSGIARELEARTQTLANNQEKRASDTTPKHLVQLECESDRAVYCTQYIARSLSARNAEPGSGVGGDRSLAFPLSPFSLEVSV